MVTYQFPSDAKVTGQGSPASDFDQLCDLVGLLYSALGQLAGAGTNLDPSGDATNLAALVAMRTAASLAPGASGTVFTSNGASSRPTWQAGGLSNPMTTPWDLIRGGTSGAPTRFAIGSNGQFLGVSAGALAWLNGPGSGFLVIQPSGDTTGATDVTNINAAITTLNASGGGVILLAPGAWYINATITVPATTTGGTAPPGGEGGNPVSVLGCGPCTVVYVVGGITGVSYHRSSGYGAQFGQPAQPSMGYLRDFVIDGTYATNGAIGLSAGDGWGLDINLEVVNFSAPYSIGADLTTLVFWEEKQRIRLHLKNNATACVLDSAVSDISHEYCDLDLYIFANAGQQGIVCQNGVNLGGERVSLHGNMSSGTASSQGAFSFTATSASPCVFTCSALPGSFSVTATHASPAVFTAAGSCPVNGQAVQLSGGTAPGGFSNATTYYVVAATGGTSFQLASSPGGTPINSTSTGSGETVTCGLAAGTPVQLSGTPPQGLTAAVTYYVLPVSPSTFQLAATPNGAALGSTSTGSGTVTTCFAALSFNGYWPKNFSATIPNSSSTWTASGSSFVPGNMVTLSGLTGAGGFSAGTYYVVSASGTTFSLSATYGGSAITSSSSGSATAAGPNNFSRLYEAHLVMKIEGNPGNGDGTVFPFGLSFDAGPYVGQSAGIITHSLADSNVNGGEFTFTGSVSGDPNLSKQYPVGPGTNVATSSSQPAVPASGTALDNLGPAMTVYVTANASGTCAVQVNNTVILTMAAGTTLPFPVNAGGSIKLTYTDAPTWVWVTGALMQF